MSLATGLNHYLKYYCKVSVSQVREQAKMPSPPPALINAILKETKAKLRYAYNYCTLSYTMGFWGEKECRNELDWLALNGINIVLDITAQEEVWRRFLNRIGYTHEKIKKFLAEPGYYSCVYMGNLYGFGGPVHDSWFEERTELARRNHLIMRKLRICPILQGYGGMVPVDITEHDSKAEVIPQGTWCADTRPFMLKTTAPVFRNMRPSFIRPRKKFTVNLAIILIQTHSMKAEMLEVYLQ